MRLLVSSLFSFLILSAQAQTVANLNDLNEFERFQFGMSTQDLPGQLELDLVVSYGLKYYKYRDKSLKEIFGFKIIAVNLGFRNDQLEYLDFYFNKLDKEEFDQMKHRLEVRFGFSSTVDAIEKGVTDAVQWASQRVIVDLYRFEKESIDINDQNKTVLAISWLIKNN